MYVSMSISHESIRYSVMNSAISLLIGWMLDLLIGDPIRLPHPIVWFGKMIAFLEHRLNKGAHRKLKGALTVLFLVGVVFLVTWGIRYFLSPYPSYLTILFDAIIIFYCLAGTTLIREVLAVFRALDRSLDEGRQQVARIVGRDTTELSAQYRDFGCWAAHMDDIANYLPARLTAFLMILSQRNCFSPSLYRFVWCNGKKHASRSTSPILVTTTVC